MYRILTEDKNRESIFRILDSHVDGYTVSPVMGLMARPARGESSD